MPRRVVGIFVALVGISTGLNKPTSAEVTFDWVTIGNPGNAPDLLNVEVFPGIGSITYGYRIAKYEVTNNQYAEYLNAVAATDANNLYEARMGSDTRGGIAQSGVSGSFSYSVKANMGNKPVNFVSFIYALRFINWLHNDQPVGAQDANSTEDGVYTIEDGGTEFRQVDSRVFLPTEGEWYKAAFHDMRTEAEGGPPGDDHYWLFPTRSDSAPLLATASPHRIHNSPRLIPGC